MKAAVKTIKEGVETGGSTLPGSDREAKVETPKPPIFKGVCDSQRGGKLFVALKELLQV